MPRGRRAAGPMLGPLVCLAAALTAGCTSTETSVAPVSPAASAAPVSPVSPVSPSEQTAGRSAVPVAAVGQRVVVVRHTDGDTLHVRLAEDGPAGRRGAEVTVRLLEVDTPESKDPRLPVQCYALEASEALARLLPVGATAWAEADRDLLDPYGRTLLYLRTVRAGRVVFVNRWLLEHGYAEAVLFPPNDRYIGLMRRAEARAAAAGRGMWSACPPDGGSRG